MKELKLWYYRHFNVITKETAINYNLSHSHDVESESEAMNYKCLSFWEDNKGRLYRVEPARDYFGYSV